MNVLQYWLKLLIWCFFSLWNRQNLILESKVILEVFPPLYWISPKSIRYNIKPFNRFLYMCLDFFVTSGVGFNTLNDIHCMHPLKLLHSEVIWVWTGSTIFIRPCINLISVRTLHKYFQRHKFIWNLSIWPHRKHRRKTLSRMDSHIRIFLSDHSIFTTVLCVFILSYSEFTLSSTPTSSY